MRFFFNKKRPTYIPVTDQRSMLVTLQNWVKIEKLTGEVDGSVLPTPFEMTATVSFHPSRNNGICFSLEAGNNDDRMSEPKMNYDLLLTCGEYCTVVIYITTL